VNLRRLPHLVATTLVAAVVGVLAAGPALAEPTADIGSVDTADDTARVLVSLLDLPAGAETDLDGVTVTLDGEEVDALAEPASDATEQVTRISVLAIDTSLSMSGKRFAEAKQAALAFIADAPEDVRIGIVSFSDSAELVARPTRNRARLVTAIEGLALSRQTRLYDGIAEAVRVAGFADSGAVLVLSDGKDTSGVPADELTASLETLGVRVNVVALEQDARQQELLGTIAEAAGGIVLDAADPDALTTLFTEQAAVLAAQLVVSFDVPADWAGGDATVAVSVPTGATTVTDEAFVNVPAGSAAREAAAAPTALVPVEASGFRVSKPLMIGGVVGIGLAVLVIVMAFSSGNTEEKETVSDRLEAYTGRRRAGGPAPGAAAGNTLGVKQQVLEATEKALANGGLAVKVAARLEAAGLKLNAAEWLLLHAGIAVVLPFAGFLFTGGNILFALVLLPVGIVGPWFYLGRKRSKRVKTFAAQLPETLQLISGSLSAGLAFNQALDTVVREGSEPMAGEFRRALVEARLGVSIEDALNGIAERMESDDFAWMVMAVKIQREVGGNLAELLTTVAATLREREYLRRQVSTLSAEGRLSAWIVGGMPPVFTAYLAMAQPEYLKPLIESPMGWVLIGFGVVLMTVGAFWLSKTVKVEV
jgi:tight adherence protein B